MRKEGTKKKGNRALNTLANLA